MMRAGVCWLSLALSVAASAQSEISSGDLRGVVLDASGGAVAGASVTARDYAHGAERRTVSSGQGEYRFSSLPPGQFLVRIEAPGFDPATIASVTVRIGETVALRTTLELAAQLTVIEVSGQAPLVDQDRTHQATSIETSRIENLPINQRNYLGLALLAPTVTSSDDLVDDVDYRITQTPHSGLSFSGSNGRQNTFSIDGVENDYNSGGVRPSVSQDAVQEFQINRSGFSAQTGWAAGGSINVVTRSGGNQWRGTAFGFLRDRAFQARNYFDPVKSAFTRTQDGVAGGGPLRKDRTFLYAALERLDRHETAFVPLLWDQSVFGVMTPSQTALAAFLDGSGVPDFRALAGVMRRILITNDFPGTLALFRNNSGEFPFSEGDTQLSLRLDEQASPRHGLFLRGNLTRDRNANAQFGSLVAFNRGRTIKGFDGTWALRDTWVRNAHWVSETWAAFGYNNLEVLPTDPIGPSFDITGFGFFGRDIFLPSKTVERHYLVQHVTSIVAGRHEFKFGGAVNPVQDVVRSDTYFAGRFGFGEAVPLGAVLDLVSGNPGLDATLAGALASANQSGLAASLEAPITALQSFNLGIPTFYQQGFGDPTWRGWFNRDSVFLTDSWRAAPTLTIDAGIRYELELKDRFMPADYRCVAPRLGFAWSPGRSARTVIRGGYGLFFGPINAPMNYVAEKFSGDSLVTVLVPATGLPGVDNPLTGRPLTSIDIYQTLTAEGILGQREIRASDLAQFGLTPSPNLPFAVQFGIDPKFQNPYSEQASLEIERRLGDTSLSAAYTFNRGAHLVTSRDTNLYQAGTRPDGSPIFGFFNPAVLQRDIYESAASSFYHALTLQWNRRLERHVAVNAHYTWSKAIDDTTDYNPDYQPNNQLNARADRALSSFHQSHRVVASAILESPVKGKHGVGRALAGFTLSPILSVHSGQPFNILTGYDNLGDNHPTTHRPWGAGRNIGKGPAFFTADFRLARTFPLGAESRRLEFTAEAFNALNRTNFRSVNNTVGALPLAALPSPLTGRKGNPLDPLSFTSAFDPRQFQLGLRLHF